jgi:hypothetical protein
MAARSRRGDGSTFMIFLPAAERSADRVVVPGRAA